MDAARRNRPIALAAALAGLLLAHPGPGHAAGDQGPPPFQGRQKTFTILKPPQPAPQMPLYTMKGGVTTLRGFRGRVVLLNVWATWCAACLHELPALKNLQARLGGDGFTVLAVSVDARGADDVSPYLERLGITGLPIYLDPAGRTAEALGVYDGLPWTFVIDDEGRVMGYVMGTADWASPEAEALIRHYARRVPR
ncbi:MAG: TlpA family protein disulfide reductase [Rhodospirillales bacterium]